MTEHAELIRRLEAAVGPDRELDYEILTTVMGYRDIHGDRSFFDRGNDGYWTMDGDEHHRELPSPTASIDAALTLVPEGCQWHCGTCNEDDQPWATLTLPDWSDRDADAATVPLALCIAALRARSSHE